LGSEWFVLSHGAAKTFAEVLGFASSIRFSDEDELGCRLWVANGFFALRAAQLRP
jgi:hypothetical protein